MGRNVSLREKIGEKCLLGRKVLGRNVLGRKVFWGETSEYRVIDVLDGCCKLYEYEEKISCYIVSR